MHEPNDATPGDSSPKPIQDQLRRQGHAAMREMRTWPERMRRNLPQDWFTDESDEKERLQ